MLNRLPPPDVPQQGPPQPTFHPGFVAVPIPVTPQAEAIYNYVRQLTEQQLHQRGPLEVLGILKADGSAGDFLN